MADPSPDTTTPTAAATAPKAAHGPRLTASYTSPTNEHFTLSSDVVPSVSNDATITTQQKQASLSFLRAATGKMQEDINALLTARMDEDNARSAAASNSATGGNNTSASGKQKQKVDEDVEEDNYGEEVVDEDD